MLYGQARSSPSRQRVDLGKARPSISGSLAGIERQRQLFVTTNSDGCQPGSSSTGMPEVGKDGWTADHAKEIKFNKKKRKMTQLDQQATGSIRVPKKMRLATKLYKQYDDLMVKDYLDKKARASAVSHPPFNKANVFVAMAANLRLAAKMRKLGITTQTEPAKADICVVEDTAALPVGVHWSMILKGGCFVKPQS